MSAYSMPPAPLTSHDVPARFVRRLLAGVVIALCCSAPAFGQSMGANYSDLWLVGVNQPYTDENGDLHVGESGPPGAYVQSCEITDGSYASYGHDYTMSANLNKVGGSTTTSYGSGWTYVRLDLSMPFDSVDGDTFYSTHTTSGYCPGSHSYHTLGGAGTSSIFGVSYSVYHKVLQISPSRATYQLIQPCDVVCPYTWGTGLYRVSGVFPEYLRFGVPWVDFGSSIGIVCENVITAYHEQDAPMSCAERGR